MTDEEKRKARVEAGKKGGATVVAERGVEFMRTIAALGGAATKARHGSEHYKVIGTRGGRRMKALIEAGKRAEAVESGDVSEKGDS